MYTTNNNDTGSLKVGTTAAGKVFQVGDKIRIGDRVLTVTYVMGKGEKQHLCFKGQGKLPEGEVTYSLVDAPAIQAA